MTPKSDTQRWQALQALFHAAEAHTGAAREAHVRAACADPVMAEQVLSMLAHAESTGGLSQPIERVADALHQPRDRSGELIGPYRLIARVSFGGMAEVYTAVRDDGSFERSVALKIIRGDRAADRLHDRFQRERGRLARLEHPHIAFVFDGGDTESGEPYFVMELLRGQPFVAACLSERLRWNEVLGHMLDLCDAVAHAHQQLIIHRDIKPENVMLADTPAGRRIKLLDFGIAEVLLGDGEIGDTVDDRWYSPGFAAPEVARGERGNQATDVYSLGRLFSRLAPLCPAAQRRELEAILQHASADEAAHRYATVDALAADLRRLRQGEAIALWRTRRAYVAQRWLRRHAVALVIVSGLAGLGLGALYYERTLRLAAEQARLSAEQATTVAERERDKAQAIRDFLLAGYDSANPGRNRGEDLRVVELLDEQSKSLRESDALDRTARLDLLQAIGNAQLNLGHFEQADLTHRAMLDLTSPQQSGTHRYYATVLLGQSARQRDLLEQAEQHFLEAESLLASLPEQSIEGLRATLSFTSSWGTMLFRQNRLDEAERVLRRGLTVADQVGDDADTISSRIHLLGSLGAIHNARGDLAAARDTFLLCHRLGREHGLDATISHLSILGWLGITFDQLGDARASEPYLREAIEVAEQLFPEPNPRLSSAYGNLGAFLLFNGRLSEAQPWLQRGLDVLREIDDAQSSIYQARIQNLGALALEREDFATAERYLDESLRLRLRALGETHSQTAQTQAALGALALARNDWAEAERLTALAIPTLAAGSRGGHPSLANAMQTHALALARLGRGREASAEAARADDWIAEHRAGHAAFAANQAMFHARLAWQLGDLEHAHDRAIEAVTLWRAPTLQHELSAARAELMQRRIERALGKQFDVAARTSLERATAVFERELTHDAPTLGEARKLLAW